VPERRVRHDHGEHEQRHSADLQEARQVVARAEQEPHRQHRGDEPVDAQREDRLVLGEGEVRGEGRAGERLAEDDRAEHEGAAEQRRLGDAAGPDAVDPQPDEQRDRDGRGDGEGAPG